MLCIAYYYYELVEYYYAYYELVCILEVVAKNLLFHDVRARMYVIARSPAGTSCVRHT